VGDVKHRKKEFNMNKKNWAFGLVFVAMMVLGLMTIGCPTENKEEPEETRVVAEQYRGTFIAAQTNQELQKAIFSGDTVFYEFKSGNNLTLKAYTVENGLYIVADGQSVKYGRFSSDNNTYTDIAGSSGQTLKRSQ
jgi:hypothetical protein